MSKYNLTEEAIHNLGYMTGGFPIGKKQLVEIFEKEGWQEFDVLKEKMRSALMRIHADDWTMEVIADAAHICAVVAFKTQPPTSETPQL